jgi:O-antigen/teichoic acid export membrane protein
MKKIKAKIVKLLLWSQKYTRADMLYLAKGGFWVMFGQGMNGILSLATLVAFANLLPKETYGLYKYILSILGILNIFTLTGMNSAVSRSVARGNDGVLKPAVLYQLKWNSLMLVACLLLAGYYFIKDDTVLASSLFILGIFVPFTLAFGTYGSYLEGKKQFRTANIFGIISTFTYSIGILIAIILSDEVIWLIATYALTTFISSFIFYLYTIKKFNPPVAGNAEETLAYGRTLTYIRLLGPIISQIDKIILAHFWGPAQLATYAFASAIPSKSGPALKKIIDIGFPKFATNTHEKINTIFYKRIFQGLLIGTIVAIFYALIAPYLFTHLLPQYTDGIVYSQILGLTLIFALPTRYIGLLFESQKMTRVTLINTTINSFIAIFLFVGLGMAGGLLGLTIAVVLHSFLGFLVNLISWKVNT